jgi:hypothetical protein
MLSVLEHPPPPINGLARKRFPDRTRSGSGPVQEHERTLESNSTRGDLARRCPTDVRRALIVPVALCTLLFGIGGALGQGSYHGSE